MKRLALPRIRAALATHRSSRLAVEVAIVAALYVGASAAYRGSKGHVQNCDSAYSLVVSEKMLREGTADLRSCIPDDAAARQAMQGYDGGSDLPYQLVRRTSYRTGDEEVYYGYPLGSSILSLPLVYYYGTGRGLSTLQPDGRPNLAIENILQLRIAARISAAIVVLFYIIARFFCPPMTSLFIAAGFAFGSPVWSTLSRALWSHTWMVFCLSLALLLVLARRSIGRQSWRLDLFFGLTLGTSLFCMLFVRAHGVFSAAAIGTYLVLHHRRMLLITIVSGATWSAALVGVSLSYFGTPMPPSVYDAAAIDGHEVLNRFAWLMLSPSRGLLVYCPYMAVAAAILLGFWRYVTDAGLLLPAGLALAAHTALFACYNGWHGGSSYGPRYFADLLPWFVVVVALAAQGLASAHQLATSSWRIAVAAAVLAASFGWGAFVHARGANSNDAWFWNARSIAVGQEAAVKEWQYPQFLAGLTFEISLQDGSVRELK